MPRFSALVFIFSMAVSCAQAELRRGSDLQLVGLDDVALMVKPGMVLLIGENHDNAVHSAQHIELLKKLEARGLKVSVGMEFLSYPDQPQVDAFLRREVDEAAFLRAVVWGSTNFAYYREQILFPRRTQGWTYALNAPRSLSSKISKTGVASLTPEEQAQLPPQFSRGSDPYFERFKAAMGGHLPSPEATERYFMAQSLWDDTMAWQAQKALQKDPAQVLVIVVGEFHVQYGGGLPDRLRARGTHELLTISQLNIQGLSVDEVKTELSPTGPYGARADVLWVSSF